VDVPLHHGLHQSPLLWSKAALFDENLSQWLVLVQNPGVHGPQEVVAADEVHLQGQDAEQQVAIGGRGTGRGFGHDRASSFGSEG
jgi:hypothetical protein